MWDESLTKTQTFNIPFIGRKSELTLLREMLEKAYNYQGNFLLIKGDIGIGKTRLIQQFVQNINQSNIQVLFGKGIKDEIKAFAPFSTIIEEYITNLEGAMEKRWLTRIFPPESALYLGYIMPIFKAHYPIVLQQVEERIDRSQIIYSFEQFFENLSKYNVLVLFLDDIMWIRDDALDLLRYLVMRISDKPILCIATARSDEINSNLQELIDELNSNRQIVIINLDNLSQNEVESLLSEQFMIDIPIHFLQWLYSLTRGNPLFIAEILKTLLRQNIIVYDSNKNEWSIRSDYQDFTISDTVEGVINYRLSQLKPSELQLLQAAAVIGENFDVEILKKLLVSESRNRIIKSCNTLTNLRIIEGIHNKKQFCHPLIREILYQRIEPEKRRQMHRKLARVLANSGADENTVLYHRTKYLIQGEGTKKLVRYLINTSAKLFATYNYHSAWHYLKIAEEMAEQISNAERERIIIKAKLNYLGWTLGRDVVPLEQAESFVSELEKSKLKDDFVAYCEMLFNRMLSTQRFESAEIYLNKALSRIQKSNPFYYKLLADRLLLLRRKGLLQEAIKEAEKLSSIIPQDKAPDAFYKTLNSIGMVAIMKGDYELARKSIFRALKVAQHYNILPYIGDSLMNLGLAEMEMGNLDSALKNFEESLNYAKILQRDPTISINLLYMSLCHIHRGDNDKAIQILDRVIERAKNFYNVRLKASVQLLKTKIYLDTDNIPLAEETINGISPNDMDIGGQVDLDCLKAILCGKKGNFLQAIDIIDKLLPRLKSLNLKSRYARALGEKALIYLYQNKKDEAFKYFKESKNLLESGKKLPQLSHLLIDFGFHLGQKEGEELLFNGLQMLFNMGGTERMKWLYPKLKKARFIKCCNFISEKTSNLIIDKTIISTFGGLQIKRPMDVSELSKSEWPSRKAQELLGLLLVAPKSGATREAMASSLWPEATKDKAQLNFRVALTHLKKILGEDVIIQSGQFILLDMDIIEVDFLTFENLYKEWQGLKREGKLHTAEDRARRSLDLYKDDFLPEFYSEPILRKNMELKTKMKIMLSWLALRSLEKMDYQESIFMAQRLLAFDHLDEKAHQIIMESLYNQGDRNGALRQFEILKRNFKEELDAEPGAETIKLYKKILSTD
ncbi:MAG: AAA family ATPase [candidate division WOR-3 bacterium]